MRAEGWEEAGMGALPLAGPVNLSTPTPAQSLGLTLLGLDLLDRSSPQQSLFLPVVLITRMEPEGSRDEGAESESRVYSTCPVSGRYRTLTVSSFPDMTHIAKSCPESTMTTSACRSTAKKP